MLRGRRALNLKYLTPAEVANMLHLSRRKVLSLDIPRVRVGEGRGKILFNEEDVKNYLSERTEYPSIKGGCDADRIPKEQKKVGLSVLPSRENLEKIRLGF